MSDQKIKAQFIFEMLGKPAEHLKETLENLLKKLDEQKVPTYNRYMWYKGKLWYRENPWNKWKIVIDKGSQ